MHVLGMHRREISLAVYLLGSFLCACAPSPSEAYRSLAGEYKLVLGDLTANQRLKSSELILRTDGTAKQVCTFQDGVIDSLDGTWQYREQPSLFLSNFRDCAGVWAGVANSSAAANLIVEFDHGEPKIILNPDSTGTYYEKQ